MPIWLLCFSIAGSILFIVFWLPWLIQIRLFFSDLNSCELRATVKVLGTGLTLVPRRRKTSLSPILFRRTVNLKAGTRRRKSALERHGWIPAAIKILFERVHFQKLEILGQGGFGNPAITGLVSGFLNAAESLDSRFVHRWNPDFGMGKWDGEIRISWSIVPAAFLVSWIARVVKQKV